MPHHLASPAASDTTFFTSSLPPPPPYSETNNPAGARPSLPETKRNVHLNALPADAHTVKFQTIIRDGREIVVGRVKVPTPGSHTHAFILRRYDTNAISLSTMFKVAFPGATETEEAQEIEWVKRSFDTSNTNGGRDFDAVRLAGQWISRHLATHLAPAYNMPSVIESLAVAVPDPNVQYRKSQRSQAAAAGANDQRPVPSLAADSNVPQPKRVRLEPQDESVASVADAPMGSDASNEENMNAEIAQAKQLVKELKRAIETREAQEERGVDLAESHRGTKRGQTSDGVVISGSSATKGRVIKSNQRVRGNQVVRGGIKTVAYGSIILGIGLGLGALIPQLLG